MRRLAWGALTGGWMLAVACTTGGPFQDVPDADVDASWKVSHPDAAEPTPDAIVLAIPDATAEAGTDATSDTGAGIDEASLLEGSADGHAGDADGPHCSLTSCGTRSVCAGGLCVLARRVFVSSATSTGNLGGTAGADATCQHLASVAGLGGVWMAWVSDGASSPSTRFNQASYEYALLGGTVVASSWKALTGGALAHGIDQDEHGQPVSGTSEVWTATNTDGTLQADGCTSFTSGSNGAPIVQVGISGNADATWTAVYQQYCDRSDHVYCVEQ